MKGAAWQTPANHLGSGRELLAVAAEHHLEGVVAKRLDAPYLPGARSRNWLKVKNSARQELVIGGWLPGKGRRAQRIGALLMGYYERRGRSSLLRYAGRVGTGFDERELERLGAELASRERRESPFAEVGAQPPRGARFVEPDLVAEVEFTDWTRERLMRQPSYKGLRNDRAARDVRIELPSRQGAAIAKGVGIERSAMAKNTTIATDAGTAIETDATMAPGSRPTKTQAHARVCARARGSATGKAHASPAEKTRGSAAGKAPARKPEPPYRIVRENAKGTEIEVQGRALRLTNRDKVMYPESGFTKGELVDYYAAVAPVVLGHLAARPLTLKRYPDGVDGEFFYEKRAPAHRPDWVKTVPVWSEDRRERIDYCLAEDLPTLIWLANLADIELHTSLSRAPDLDVPTSLVFDLDPGAPAGIKECCRVALQIKELFDTFGLVTVVKTSGAKGLHVHVPLNTHVTYAQTKPLALAVAGLMAREHPKLVVSDMRKRLRDGRVLIDWSQNDAHKTTVSVYSLRARKQPTISTPLSWEEVGRAARRRREQSLSAQPHELLARIERDGDLYAPMLTLAQNLPELT
ncbi:MAG TPA: non-homologous end-joining DNA ligase [Solirubrobacteraceae bacterium]|nr:non-homologous end-joining DNA ligase [Solirubrobacteraceae bacterium]